MRYLVTHKMTHSDQKDEDFYILIGAKNCISIKHAILDALVMSNYKTGENIVMIEMPTADDALEIYETYGEDNSCFDYLTIWVQHTTDKDRNMTLFSAKIKNISDNCLVISAENIVKQ